MKPFSAFEGFDILLAAAGLKTLLPHEEVIESEVRKLSESMNKDSVQRDPIIVDLSSRTILDGMHRYHSLKKLGAVSCIVCYVKYEDDRIKVGRWVRRLDVDSKICKDIAYSLGMIEFSEPRLALKKVDEGSIQAAIVSYEKAFVSLDKSNEYPKKFVKNFDNEVNRMGLNVEIVYDDSVDKLLVPSKCIFYPRPPSKEQIVSSAKSGDLFPAKSTRHEIPYRPVGVNFPLERLFNRDMNETNLALKEILTRRRRRILEPGTEFHGRIYRETLVSYEEEKSA